MEIEKVFGNKEKFAIEIASKSKIDKSKLRLWIFGQSIGNFKREDRLTSSICNFKKLLYHKDTLYDESFESLSPKEIYDLSFDQNLTYDEYHSVVMKYIRWMGEQMDEHSMKAYYKDNKFEWIVYDVKKKKVLNFTIKEIDLVNAVTEYIRWYEDEYGEVRCNYNKFP